MDSPPRIGIALPLLLGAWTTTLYAQPGSLDSGFNAASITGEVEFSVAGHPDGKVITVGTFGVKRFPSDGSVDPAFQSIPPGPTPFAGPGSGVGRVLVQPDARIGRVAPRAAVLFTVRASGRRD